MAGRPVGRPRTLSAEESRQYVGFAVPRFLKEQLEKAARKSGRSLAQECVSRLERSFRDDDIVSAVIDRLQLKEPAAELGSLPPAL